MPFLSVSKHKRRDQGVQYTISTDYRQILLDRFIPGTAEEDPVLEWYIDVRCRGHAVPTGPVDVRSWLVSNSEVIKQGLDEFANQFATGLKEPIKSSIYDLPVGYDIKNPPAGTIMEILVSMTRHISEQEMSTELKRLHDEWDELIAAIEVPTPQRLGA